MAIIVLTYDIATKQLVYISCHERYYILWPAQERQPGTMERKMNIPALIPYLLHLKCPTVKSLRHKWRFVLFSSHWQVCFWQGLRVKERHRIIVAAILL